MILRKIQPGHVFYIEEPCEEGTVNLSAPVRGSSLKYASFHRVQKFPKHALYIWN